LPGIAIPFRNISPQSGTALAISYIKISIMPILTILLVLIVVGVILWLINTYIPMDSKIKSILNVVVVVILIIWLLQAFGLLDSLKHLKV
jgi:hypothetical protein